jgi:hypothetical protein
MARRQARRRASTARNDVPRGTQPSSPPWRYWLMAVVVALLAIIMVVTSLPLQ